MIRDEDGRMILPGLYEARVESDIDPQHRNRIRVRVFALHNDDTPPSNLPYAKACHNRFGNDSGDKRPPNKGEIGWVMFEKGDADFPVWMGGQLESGDTRSGSRSERIDGDDKLHVKRNRTTTIDKNETKTVKGSETTEVKKSATHTYQTLGEVVVGGKSYSYGRISGNVNGDVEESITGSTILQILGHRKLTVAESLEIGIGGSERRYVVQQMVYKASNAGGLPIADAMLFEAINGRLNLAAKNLLGVEGASLLLDPSGLATQLRSIGVLTLESPVTKIGPVGQATVPITTLTHTHTVFGIPTTTVTPGLGAPLSVLGPAV